MSIKERDGEEYISLYASALALGGSGKFDGVSRTMKVSVEGRVLSAQSGASYIKADKKKIVGRSNFIYGNVLYVPLTSFAKALGKEAQSCAGGKKLTERASGAQETLDPDCVLWLARIIYCESRGQPFEGQVAVGSVVMNRVDSDEFPNTIFSVIFDRKYGVQFTPAGNGAVWCTPDETAIRAAETVLRGQRTDRRILYFMNESLATSSWISDNREFAFKIGDHSFYD